MTMGNVERIKELFKFSWAQAFSDENGKSSVFSMCCFITIVTGCIGFLYSLFLKQADGLMYSSGIITVGLGALTGRKFVVGKPTQLPVVEEEVPAKEEGA